MTSSPFISKLTNIEICYHQTDSYVMNQFCLFLQKCTNLQSLTFYCFSDDATNTIINDIINIIGTLHNLRTLSLYNKLHNYTGLYHI